MDKNLLLIYIGHHKCATTWINGIIRQVCGQLELTFYNVHNPTMFDHNLERFVHNNTINFLSYTSEDLTYLKQLNRFKGFHVIRDPRDIVVSAYFSHLYSHPTDEWPELVSHRERLRKVSKEEGLLLEMDFRAKEFEDLQKWDYSHPNICEIKMEELIQKPYEIFVEIFMFLGLIKTTIYPLKSQIYHLGFQILNRIHVKTKVIIPFYHHFRYISLPEFLAIIYYNRFSVKAEGRKPGKEDCKSHYRKGISSDWKNHFTQKNKRYFKEKYNNLLITLGYEIDLDW